jgi:hypothetical protein
MSIILENEKVTYEVRKHPFYFYSRVASALVLAIIPWFLYSFIIETILKVDVLAINAFFIFVYSLLLILVWIYTFVAWTDYFVDTWIITDSRVIDFELKGMFNKDVVSVRLENVEDVKVKVNGLIEHWLKIGDISLQTAATDKEFIIRGIYNPDGVKAKIFEAIHSHHNTK